MKNKLIHLFKLCFMSIANLIVGIFVMFVLLPILAPFIYFRNRTLFHYEYANWKKVFTSKSTLTDIFSTSFLLKDEQE